MGTTFFVEEGVKKYMYSIPVYGSKMATGEVMFLVAVAWVKGGGVKEGGETFYT